MFASLENIVSAKLIFEKTTPPLEDDICVYIAYKKNNVLQCIQAPQLSDMTLYFSIPAQFKDCDILVYVWNRDMMSLMKVQRYKEGE